MHQRKLTQFEATLRKAIKNRSQITNKVNKTRNATDVSNYKKQRNYVERIILIG